MPTLEDFTQLCGQNLTLDQPTESLKINFDVPTSEQVSNCTSFILWAGEAQFKLLPYTARTDLSVPVDGTAQVVLSITDFVGKIIKLDMLGAKPFYLSISAVQGKCMVWWQAVCMHKYVHVSQLDSIVESTGNGTHRYCAAYYRTCDWHHCIHNMFLCDDVVQCAGDETLCYQSESVLLTRCAGQCAFPFTTFFCPQSPLTPSCCSLSWA